MFNRYTTTIRRNSAECLKCGDHIESKHVHDFRYCSCKAIAVDGGYEYIRRVGKPENYFDTSIWETQGGMSYLGKILLTHCDNDLRIDLKELARKMHWDWRFEPRAKLVATHLGLTIIGGS